MNVHGQSFPKSARLLNKHQFSAVFEQNQRKASNRFALVLALPSEAANSRLGLVVSKKSVRLACQRNRIKRQIREYFRLNPLSASWDLVLLTRNGIGELSNAELRKQLAHLWQKIDSASNRTGERRVAGDAVHIVSQDKEDDGSKRQ